MSRDRVRLTERGFNPKTGSFSSRKADPFTMHQTPVPTSIDEYTMGDTSTWLEDVDTRRPWRDERRNTMGFPEFLPSTFADRESRVAFAKKVANSALQAASIMLPGAPTHTLESQAKDLMNMPPSALRKTLSRLKRVAEEAEEAKDTEDKDTDSEDTKEASDKLSEKRAGLTRKIREALKLAKECKGANLKAEEKQARSLAMKLSAELRAAEESEESDKDEDAEKESKAASLRLAIKRLAESTKSSADADKEEDPKEESEKEDDSKDEESEDDTAKKAQIQFKKMTEKLKNEKRLAAEKLKKLAEEKEKEEKEKEEAEKSAADEADKDAEESDKDAEDDTEEDSDKTSSDEMSDHELESILEAGLLTSTASSNDILDEIFASEPVRKSASTGTKRGVAKLGGSPRAEDYSQYDLSSLWKMGPTQEDVERAKSKK